jgi:hypothetical protein
MFMVFAGLSVVMQLAAQAPAHPEQNGRLAAVSVGVRPNLFAVSEGRSSNRDLLSEFLGSQ